ncbi:hypothetical protein ACFZB9_36110 [Kitasatospora sp. NPDC008050]|uniref:hypothetical protein n=1 Tax=Kitasatospora sp. NPDC008050 TaxID=3364021 RepID=UPI0036E7EABB
MRTSIKALTVTAVAAGAVSLATVPAFADTLTNYQGGVTWTKLYIGSTTCEAVIDKAYDSTLGYEVARGAFISNGPTCKGALYRSTDGGRTWIQASDVYSFGSSSGWVRTGYHWDTPGEVVNRVCISTGSVAPIDGGCSYAV